MRRKIFALFCLVLWLSVLGGCARLLSPAGAKYTPVQHNGRVKPFDSFARQTVKFITGRETWNRQSAMALVRNALAHKDQIPEMKWVRVDTWELRQALGLPRDELYFSLNELLPSLNKVKSLARDAKVKRDADIRPGKIEQKAEQLYTKMGTLQALLEGRAYSEIPVSQAYRAKIWLEVQYNALKPFQGAAVAYLLSFAFLVLFKKSGAARRWGARMLALAIAFHTLGIACRVIILARPPVSNMYESMIFMNWALILFAAVFSMLLKNMTALTAGALASGLVMIYGDLLPLDTSLEVLVPVLRSNYWLSVHVMTVVSSYGAFGLAMALGHRHLFAACFDKKFTKKAREESAQLIDRVVQLGVLLIGTGTMLGGVWANESWGRFWGWDPKETWALITFLGYLVAVHLRHLEKMGDFALALFSVLGFGLVLMTWYGVNFVLGRGLHSYGAGSGGMRWVIYYLVFEAIFIACVFFKRLSRNRAPGRGLPEE